MMHSLRNQLIRLAHARPEFRKDILAALKKAEEEDAQVEENKKEACGCSEAPMVARFEEGKPADPTENMSPEDAKVWHEMHDKHKDNFKNASELALRNNLIRLAHAHPEFRKDILPLLKQAEEDSEEPKKEAGTKVGGMVRHRVPMMVVVYTQSATRDPADEQFISIKGKIFLEIGSGDGVPVRFEAVVREDAPGEYSFGSFTPVQSLSGAGADSILSFYRSVFSELLETDGQQMVGHLL